MSLLKKKVSAPLKDGAYECHLQAFQEIANDKGGYISLTWTTGNRSFKTSIFENNLEFWAGGILAQTSLEETMDLEDVFNFLVSSKSLITIYVSHNSYGINFSPYPPREVQDPGNEIDLSDLPFDIVR